MIIQAISQPLSVVAVQIPQTMHLFTIPLQISPQMINASIEKTNQFSVLISSITESAQTADGHQR
jgi:hypothetical protein